MQQTPCDECGKPITSKARLEAGISFCSKACEFEDERKSNAKLGLQNSYQLDRHDEMLANADPSDFLCDHGKALGDCWCDYEEPDGVENETNNLVELITEDQELADEKEAGSDYDQLDYNRSSTRDWVVDLLERNY